METVLEHRTVKTKKPHGCWGCAELFPVGSLLTLRRTVESGEFCTSYWCDICEEVWQKYMTADDTIDIGELKENYPEEYSQSGIRTGGQNEKEH